MAEALCIQDEVYFSGICSLIKKRSYAWSINMDAYSNIPCRFQMVMLD
jgi:hypothetical protein